MLICKTNCPSLSESPGEKVNVGKWIRVGVFVKTGRVDPGNGNGAVESQRALGTIHSARRTKQGLWCAPDLSTVYNYDLPCGVFLII